MSGIAVGELILWLDRRVDRDRRGGLHRELAVSPVLQGVSFVRTGFLGEQVVINGGAFVLPFIHDFTPVNMNVLSMPITRSKQDAVITRDRHAHRHRSRFLCPGAADARSGLDRRSDSRSANARTERLHALLSGKFVSAMRAVARKMTMEQMHEKRGDYVARVKAAAAEALAQNGLELESVAITDLDQTDSNSSTHRTASTRRA